MTHQCNGYQSRYWEHHLGNYFECLSCATSAPFSPELRDQCPEDVKHPPEAILGVKLAEHRSVVHRGRKEHGRLRGTVRGGLRLTLKAQ